MFDWKNKKPPGYKDRKIQIIILEKSIESNTNTNNRVKGGSYEDTMKVMVIDYWTWQLIIEHGTNRLDT